MPPCYLQNNNLSGAIPAALLQRKRASLLEYSGNSLCESSTADCLPSPGSSAGPNGSFPSPPSEESSTGAIVGGAVGAILVVTIAIGIAVYCCCFTKKPPVQKDPKVGSIVPQSSPKRELQINQINNNQSPGIPVLNKAILKHPVQEFSYEEILIATNNFKTKLGQGAFGPVYKGCLQDGRFVAIKVASNSANQGIKEFLNEVDLLSRVHHKNLVGLLGFCNEQRLVLVYEFMYNGSLFDCLHGPCAAAASPLSWRTRLRIMVDAAQDYIWSETGPPPTTLMGSIGYMDPEYMSNMELTEKVDIYSFGVLLIEVISGQTAIFKDSLQQPTNLVEWVKAYIDRGVIDEIVDVSLHGQYDDQSAWKVAACVERPSSKRPKISEVHFELKEAEKTELESKERNAIDQPSVEFIGNSNCSTLSYTHVSARKGPSYSWPMTLQLP
ncbi:hypothetical protein L7F22_003453 [Adiantum nelumboides]|nr:hypothetical protein [Adiantum nelumboides]